MSQNSADNSMPFGRRNYIFLMLGVLLILLGYFLMSTEEFIDATEFSLSLHVSPPLIILGFAVCVYATIINPAGKGGTDIDEEETKDTGGV